MQRGAPRLLYNRIAPFFVGYYRRIRDSFTYRIYKNRK